MAFQITSFLDSSFSTIGYHFDQKILKYNILFKIFSKFFEKTSRITNYLLFDSIGYWFFILTFGFAIIYFNNDFGFFIDNLGRFGLLNFFEIFNSF